MCNTIYVFRHGKTTWNDEGRLQGWLDSPLLVAPSPSKLAVDYVVSSDLPRAMATANALFPQHAVHTDARLREIYLGHWQGERIAELMQTGEYRCYASAPQHFEPTTQESFADVTKRMREVIDELFALPYDTIAVVSHGIAIACLQCTIENRSIADVHNVMLDGEQYITLTEAIFTKN